MPDLKQKPGVRGVTIAIVRNRQDALRIQQKLEAEGIECFQTQERSFATDRTTGGEVGAVKVQVDRSNVQPALRILSAKHNAEAGEPDAKSPRPGAQAPRTSRRTPNRVTTPVLAVALILLAALILFIL